MKDKKKNQKKPVLEIKLLKDRIKELEKLTLEHKKMEEELRESEQRFQTIFDGAIDGLLLADLDTRKFSIGNRRICEMLGYELDEINKIGFDDIHPKDALPHVLEQVRKQVAGETAVAEDLPVLRKNGSIFYADIASSPLQIGGKPFLLGIFRDITERKKAEETLKESEHKFRTIFDKASDGMFLVDVETRKFLMCNAMCLQTLGYAQEEFLNLEISDILPKDDVPLVFEQIAKFLKGGEEGVRHDVRFRRKDGSLFFSDLSPALITLAGKKFFLIVYKDITERKKLEEEKELNERRLLDLLELYKIAGFREKAIFDFTLEASLRSLQSEFAFLGFLSADETEMTIQAWTKGAMELCDLAETPIHFPIAQSGLWGEIVRQRRPIIVNNYETSSKFKKGYPTGHVPIKRFLGVPVFSADKIACVAAVANKVSEYTISDVRAFTAVLSEMWYITERTQIENEKRQANEKLAVLVKKLEDKNTQNIILGEMREMLQACSTMEEGAPIIRGLMQKLFPHSEGALFMMSPSRSDLESVARWGGFPEDVDDNVFAPETCWALRRGRTYIVENVSVGPLCPHLKHPPSTAYMCLPLIAKGDVLGLLHLRCRQSQIKSEENLICDLKDMAVILSEYLSLSIANIQLNERLARESVRDPLTGLFNRRFMIESLVREIKRGERNQTPVGIIMADIDHFKQFNDKYGHAAGDNVLIQMGGFFKAGLRGADIACRYGGEEFVFFLPESSAENTFKRADQIREEVKNLKVHHGGELLASITLSMGISTYPDQGSNAEDLLRVADAALYRAKQEGRDRVTID
jgi:diguanylate cyclase (GGDEF)-like protein/PAS domain S-box-containing protein